MERYLRIDVHQASCTVALPATGSQARPCRQHSQVIPDGERGGPSLALLAAQRHDRYGIGERLGVEASTLKTLVRRLLRKVGEANLQDLVGTIHRSLFREAQ